MPAAQQSNNKYEALFFASRDAVMTIEPPSWKFTSGNPSAVALFGAKDEREFLSYEPWQVSPDEQPDGSKSIVEAKKHIEKAMRDGSDFFEWTHRRINGETFVCSVLLSRVEEEHKVYLHALVRDMTAKKHMEDMLHMYEQERFKVIFENTSDGMLLADIATQKFILANTAISRMLGYTSKEIQQLGVDAIHPKEQLQFVKDQFIKLTNKEIMQASNIPVLRKDGSIFFADINASTIVMDGKTCLLGIFRDVTAQKKIAEDLRLSEEKYRLLIEQMNDGVFIIQGGEIRFINNAFARIAGYAPDEIVGKNFLDFIAPQYKELVGRRYAERQQGKPVPSTYEIVLMRKDGTLLDVVLSVGLITLGGSVASMGVIRDISERKIAEKKLQEVTTRQKVILEAIPDIIMEVDRQKTYTWANQPGIDFFGDDVLGHSADFYFIGKQTVYEVVRSVFEGSEDTTYVESWQRRKDGKKRLLAWQCKSLKDAQGNVTGALSSARDITDERETQMLLSEKEQLLRQVIDLVPHFIFAKDMESRFILVNKAVADAYGSTPQKLIGKSDIDFSATPEQAKHFHEDDLMVIHGGKPKFIPEEPIKDAKGTVRYLQTTKIPFYISRGAAKGLLGVSVDITEQKQLREKILEDKSKDEAILESIGDAVFACDERGTIMLFNGMAERISGVSSRDAVGHSYHDVLQFIKESTGKPGNDFVAEAITEKKITKMENHTLLIRKDGVKIPVADSAAPIMNEQGAIIGCVVVFHDMTREYQIDKAKTEFVSLASHQLRTPLTTINWYAEMLLSDGIAAMTKKQQQYLRETYNASKRMVELIDALLNVSRLELGTFVIEPENVSIQDIAKTCIKDLQPLIVKKKVTLQDTYDVTCQTLRADPKLIGIIFANLLSNAVKYTLPEGIVTLSIKKEQETCVITVSDTGIGIPEGQQDKIFSKLFRADNAKKIDPDGTGLGLYIVYTIVTNSGGTIQFTSDDKGTTFIIRYPMTGMVKKVGTKQLV